ncbi:MAG: hypothetical protein IBJ17_07205 [Reyranella sp.]|nr:hypothetical protein [Reyranella sp.]
MKRRLLLATAATLLATPAFAQATKWDLPAAYPATNYHSVNLQKFADAVKAGSGGKLEIVVHPGASLFKAPEIKRAVQTGQAPIGEILVSNFENEDPVYGIDVVPFAQDHGSIPSVGFRFGRIAYANDVVMLPEEAFEVLKGVEVLIVDAMRYRPHPTHAHLDRALQWIDRIKPARAFLTNMHVDMDYAEVDRATPPHVHPCFDGLQIDIL